MPQAKFFVLAFSSRINGSTFKTATGVYGGGKYIQVTSEILAQGQYLPVAEADEQPHTITAGWVEQALICHVEVLCVGREVARARRYSQNVSRKVWEAEGFNGIPDMHS